MSGAAVVDPGVGYTAVLAFVLLFAHAALDKWRRLAEFGAVLANYRLFPAAAATALAALVPGLESLLALLLLPAVTRPWAAAGGATLLLAYAAAIGINLRRGRRDLDCGCAGPAERRPIAPWMVGRNILLAAALAVAGLPWSARPLAWIDFLTIGGGLAVLVLVYLSLDRLFGQVMPRTAALRGTR